METRVAGSETGVGSGVGAETSLKVDRDRESDPKQTISDPHPCWQQPPLDCGVTDCYEVPLFFNIPETMGDGHCCGSGTHLLLSGYSVSSVLLKRWILSSISVTMGTYLLLSGYSVSNVLLKRWILSSMSVTMGIYPLQGIACFWYENPRHRLELSWHASYKIKQ